MQTKDSLQKHMMITTSKKSFWQKLFHHRYLYMMLLPVGVYYLLFWYFPMLGEVMAFKDYRFADGIWGSEWVGLKHFERLFTSDSFYLILRNTLLLNLYQLLFAFPVPIVLALMLNEIRVVWYKRTVQNMLYVPHFISWVVLGGMIISVLSPSTGVVNTILTNVFKIDPIYFMADSFWWPIVFVLSSIWRDAGWGTILFLAAMAQIDTHLYEAARIDGANKLKQMWHITLPGIRSTIAILLILKMGNFVEVGFEHIYVLQNDAVLGVSDVIQTYVYRVGLQGMQFSYTTALGLFQSVVGLILVVLVNYLIKRMGENGLW